MSRADNHFDWDEWWLNRSPKLNKIMLVEFNSGGANFIPVRQSSVPRAGAADGDADDSSVSFSAQSLQQNLPQAPQARPEKIAQAQALVADGNYPSDKALNQLAGFLANRL
jgi:anti-sigma28 factor (negative regulator of flagellin synthesis)